ncbi:MAG: NifB/NifX family molybdenum-iron cluster-binding protein [Desulfovibrio aminophilus]|uniref:NifB/NifX family molybdenum-iron cluster-binding protein n=2 Tax=Desulfovibrio TaxID=872 RepID=UPI002A387C59|nr:dinitrogenase iron-molybdenum cofactor biosynthesis protein [Desulfovibrionaceae bacterium]
MGMVICLACYEDRLASLLDTATELRLFRLDNGGAEERGRMVLPPGGCHALPQLLERAGAGVLLCGAVTGRLLHCLRAAGVDVRPWLRGGLDEVLAAWAAGSLDELRMPGCGPASGGCPPPGRRVCCRKRRRNDEDSHQRTGKGPAKPA